MADRLGAPIIKTLPGKAVIPDDSEYAVGGIGLLGTRPGENLVEDCDTLFMVGTNFPYTQHLPEPGQVKVVQIEADPTRAGLRMPTEVPVVGEAKESLQALIPLLTRKSDRGHLVKYQKDMAKWRSEMADLENGKRSPIAPQYPMGVIDDLAADDAILTCDSGTIATWAARHWTIRGDRQFYLSGNLATMAPGLPYALGIQHAFPGRQVIAYVGDGGFAMLMAEFLTAARAGLPIKVVINNNGSLGQILWEQMVLGYPEFGVRFPQPVANFAAWATACGGYGAKVDTPRRSRAPSRTRWPSTARPSSTSTWTRTSRRCPARSPTTRPRSSPRPSSRASRTRSPSPPPCSKTKSSSSRSSENPAIDRSGDRSIAEPLEADDEHQVIGRVDQERDQAFQMWAEMQHAQRHRHVLPLVVTALIVHGIDNDHCIHKGGQLRLHGWLQRGEFLLRRTV